MCSTAFSQPPMYIGALCISSTSTDSPTSGFLSTLSNSPEQTKAPHFSHIFRAGDEYGPQLNSIFCRELILSMSVVANAMSECSAILFETLNTHLFSSAFRFPPLTSKFSSRTETTTWSQGLIMSLRTLCSGSETIGISPILY